MMGLYRSGSDTIVFGVCGGLAEVLRIRPTVLRIAFSLLGLASGIGIVLYLILALILPLEGRGSNNIIETFQNNLEELVATFPARRRTLGIVLIVGGALYFLAQSGVFCVWSPAVRR